MQPSGSEASFVPESINLYDNWENERLILMDYLIKASYAINDREIAQYQNAQLTGGVNVSVTETGQEWFGTTPQQPRYGSRTVVTTSLTDKSGGIGTLTVPHGITVTANTRFTRIFGTASNPGVKYLPLPYVDADLVANNISVWVDATNVNIRYATNLSAYTDAYVCIEWVENTP